MTTNPYAAPGDDRARDAASSQSMPETPETFRIGATIWLAIAVGVIALIFVFAAL